LETVNGCHVLLVLSETSIEYVSGLVVSFAGKLKVKLNVRLEPKRRGRRVHTVNEDVENLTGLYPVAVPENVTVPPLLGRVVAD